MKRSRLTRKTPLKHRRSQPRRSSRVRDSAYMDWVRALPCCAPFEPGDYCDGRIHAHHAGRRGLGQKSDDRTCIPLCQKHHRAWHDLRDPFAGMTLAERIEWAAREVGRCQGAVCGDRGASGVSPHVHAVDDTALNIEAAADHPLVRAEVAAYIRTWAAAKKLRGLVPDVVVDALLELADDVETTA